MESFTPEQIIGFIRINRKDIKHWEKARENAETTEELDMAEKSLYIHMLRHIRLEDSLKQARSCQQA
jgi:hypothetical protein